MKIRKTPRGKETYQLMCSECRGEVFEVMIYEGEVMIVCMGCSEAAYLEDLAMPGEAGAVEVRRQ